MSEQQGKRVVVKKAQKALDDSTDSTRELLATLCFYYPQYTYTKARQLSYHRVQLLVKTARKIEATRFYNLTQIAAAPHTEKGSGVKNLLEHFEAQMNG